MEGRALRVREIAGCLCALVFGSGCATGGAPAVISAEERLRIESEILLLERQLERAYAENDLDTYFAFYADDLSQLWDSGPITLEEYEREWRALVAQGGGVVEARSEDIEVRVDPSGDSAIATYLLIARYRDPQGNVADGRYYETDVWFRRDGRWKIVHYHFSSAADEAGAAEPGNGSFR